MTVMTLLLIGNAMYVVTVVTLFLLLMRYVVTVVTLVLLIRMLHVFT